MNELKEKIARAINTANGLDTGLSHEEMRDLEHDYGDSWPDWLPEAEAALRAIEEAGYVVVKREHAPTAAASTYSMIVRGVVGESRNHD